MNAVSSLSKAAKNMFMVAYCSIRTANLRQINQLFSNLTLKKHIYHYKNILKNLQNGHKCNAGLSKKLIFEELTKHFVRRQIFLCFYHKLAFASAFSVSMSRRDFDFITSQTPLNTRTTATACFQVNTHMPAARLTDTATTGCT